MISVFKKTPPVRSAGEPLSICVWGPEGAPGRSTIAINLACELAIEGRRVMLIDLDTYSPSIADSFGLLDEKPGLAAAYRLLGQGRFDLDQLNRLSSTFEVGDGRLSVLTGLRAASRWPEINRERTLSLIDVGLKSFDFVILDVAAPLEVGVRQIGGIVERNTAALAAIEGCVKTIAVFSADPVGVRRLVDSYDHLKAQARDLILVANRLRPASLGPRAKNQVEDTVMQLCRKEIAAFIAFEPEAFDRAMLDSVPLAMMKRSSKARQAIAQFARINFLADKKHRATRVAKLD
jgi:MinD-like ATPase involved in chromosome partitioning or flagellar assembly